MNTRCYMVIIKGEIKTAEIMSCGYNRNTKKWDVKFNNGKTYSYAYLNVEKFVQQISCQMMRICPLWRRNRMHIIGVRWKPVSILHIWCMITESLSEQAV